MRRKVATLFVSEIPIHRPSLPRPLAAELPTRPSAQPPRTRPRVAMISALDSALFRAYLCPALAAPPPSSASLLRPPPPRFGALRRPPPPRIAATVVRNGAVSSPSNNGVYTVGDFMTKREELHVVKPTTSVDEALQMLVENKITGFPVIDDDWKLVGVVSDYDLLALDSISGSGQSDTGIFPEADSSWKTFNEIQTLLSKTNGKLVSEVMTAAPLVVRETTNLEDAARLLLETKYRRLPVVDGAGKLIGLITRGNVVRAALYIKRAAAKGSQS